MSSFLVSVLGLSLVAQSGGSLFTKAPPDVEQALRKAIDDFYKLYQAGKFRASEQMVCEADRDAYYNRSKKIYEDLEIVSVRYEEGFRSASVSGKARASVMTPAGALSAAVPVNSLWRVEDGKWCMYFPPPAKEIDSPFGKHRPGTGDPNVPSSALPLFSQMPTVADIQKLVQISGEQFSLRNGQKGSGEISIFNGMAGSIRVSAGGAAREGLRILLEPAVIESGKSGKVRVVFDPPNQLPQQVYMFFVAIEPTGQRFDLKVHFEEQETPKK